VRHKSKWVRVQIIHWVKGGFQGGALKNVCGKIRQTHVFVTTLGCFVTIFIVTKCYALQQEEKKKKTQSNTQGNKDDA